MPNFDETLPDDCPRQHPKILARFMRLKFSTRNELVGRTKTLSPGCLRNWAHSCDIPVAPLRRLKSSFVQAIADTFLAKLGELESPSISQLSKLLMPSSASMASTAPGLVYQCIQLYFPQRLLERLVYARDFNLTALRRTQRSHDFDHKSRIL